MCRENSLGELRAAGRATARGATAIQQVCLTSLFTKVHDIPHKDAPECARSLQGAFLLGKRRWNALHDSGGRKQQS